jgi:hypothetical protein
MGVDPPSTYGTPDIGIVICFPRVQKSSGSRTWEFRGEVEEPNLGELLRRGFARSVSAGSHRPRGEANCWDSRSLGVWLPHG